MIEFWLSTSESDEPVPDFVDRELEEPFELELPTVEVDEPSPESTKRLVEAMARVISRKRSEEQSIHEAGQSSMDEARPPVPDSGNGRSKKRPSLAKAPAKEVPDPSFAPAQPSVRLAPAARRR